MHRWTDRLTHGQSQINIPLKLFEVGGIKHVGQTYVRDDCTTSSPNEPKGSGEQKYFIHSISSKIYFKDDDSIQYCFLRFWIPLEEIYGSYNIILMFVDIEHINTK